MCKDLEEHSKEKMEKHLAMTKSKLADTASQLSVTTSRLSVAVKQINTLMVLMHHHTANTDESTIASIGEIPASTISTAKHLVKLLALAAMVKSGNQACPVILNEFSTKKAMQKDALYSYSFYSHDKGYKMCLCVYPAGNGTGKGTHMSVYLNLMKGPHDDELTWPLRGKFEVKVLNQISDCEHHVRTVTYNDRIGDDTAGRITDSSLAAGWGYSKFISHEDLHKVTPTCQYLKDDCIFLQVSKL